MRTRPITFFGMSSSTSRYRGTQKYGIRAEQKSNSSAMVKCRARAQGDDDQDVVLAEITRDGDGGCLEYGGVAHHRRLHFDR